MPKIRKRIMVLCLVICFLLSQMMIASAAEVKSVEKQRLSGSDRYKTAVAISQKGWPKGSQYAIIARGDDFADALCAGPLAKKYSAPILLTQPSELNSDTFNEIKRLGVKNVIIAGGTGAVSQKVENALTLTNIKVERLWGQDRYETSAKIAERVGTKGSVVLATGANFPDALSISSIAAKLGMPILLTYKDSIPQKVDQFIKDKNATKTYVIGGTGVISDTVKNLVPGSVRLGGQDRYETNVNVMKEFADQFNFNKLYFAVADGPKGDEFADALSGAVLASFSSSPIVLTYKSIPQVTANFIKTKMTLAVRAIALGGEAAVPQSILDTLVSYKSAIPVQATYDAAGTYGPASGTTTISGNVVISAKDVILQNTTIQGDLMLAESIGDGNVELKNVTVTGNTIVFGGGPNSIIMYNFNGKTVIVDVPDGASVRLVAQGSTSVDDLTMDCDGKLEESGLTGAGFYNVEIPEGAEVSLVGDFAEVNVNSPGIAINHEGGTITNLNIQNSAANSSVNLAASSKVTNLVASAPAAVTGTGSITNAHIASNGVTIAQTPANTTREEWVTEGQVGGKSVTEVQVIIGTTTHSTGGGTTPAAKPQITFMDNAEVNEAAKTITLKNPPYKISQAKIKVSKDCKVRISYVEDTAGSKITIGMGEWTFAAGDAGNEITLAQRISGLNLTNTISAVIRAGVSYTDIADAVNFTGMLNAVKADPNKAIVFDEIMPELFGLINSAGQDGAKSIYTAIDLKGLYGVADAATQQKIKTAMTGAVNLYLSKGMTYSGESLDTVFGYLMGDKSSEILDEINTKGWAGDFYDAIDYTKLSQAFISSPQKADIYNKINLTIIFNAMKNAGLDKTELYNCAAKVFNESKGLSSSTKEAVYNSVDINKLISDILENGKTITIGVYNTNIANPSLSDMNIYTLVAGN